MYHGVKVSRVHFGRGGKCGCGRPGGGKEMDVDKILAELKSEREQLEEAIVSLERLARGRGRRRGRPPAWMAEVPTPKRRGRPPGSQNKALSAIAGNGSSPTN